MWHCTELRNARADKFPNRARCTADQIPQAPEIDRKSRGTRTPPMQSPSNGSRSAKPTPGVLVPPELLLPGVVLGVGLGVVFGIVFGVGLGVGVGAGLAPRASMLLY